MARTNSFAQNKIDPTRPFFAAVGSVDAAVAFARDFEPKAIPTKTAALVKESVTELSDTVTGTVDEWNQQYVDLAARGRTLVNRIRRQESSQRVKDEAKKTTSQAKTTRTQSGKAADAATTSAKRAASNTAKSAGTAKSSAKATGTSARKTASATTKAAKDAAAKTGK